jgi:hypothetical protein
MIVRRSLLLMAVLLLGVVQTPALASPADASTTHAYIQANYALVQYGAARLGTAQRLIDGVLHKTKSLCPKAAFNSPQNPESTQLSNEVIGAMVLAAIHAAAPEINTYLRVAERSHWGNRALTRKIHAYASKLKTISRLAPPNLCGDVKAWAASGFHTLPASTVRFGQRFMPNWVALGEVPALLKRYASPDERVLLKRTNTLELRITDFEARAVETWGKIMETLVLYP